jgi:hypothetical protein
VTNSGDSAFGRLSRIPLPQPLGLIYLVPPLVLLWLTRGGEIQKVVSSKTNTGDIRSATIIDFAFDIVLLIFKEWSKIPMSTTWVFLGLLAGREIAMSVQLESRPLQETFGIIRRDGMKVGFGLAVSVFIAIGLPIAASAISNLTTVQPVQAQVAAPR